LDNFDDGNVTDGNPVTWSNDPLGMGLFAGNYDASSGDYSLSAPGDGNDESTLVTWVDSPSFTDVYVRSQGTILPGPEPEQVGGNLAILGRLDIATVSGYLLYLDAGGTLGLQISIGGSTSDLVPTVELSAEGITAASEVVLELNIVGMELSGYAWLASGSKPAVPQLTASDFTFASGPAGIAYQEDDDATVGVFRYAAAQDTPFVDALAGDFNGDGRVDAADYVVWRKGAQSQDDYNDWRMNFGAPAGSGSLVGSAVPEPATFFQLVVAVAAFLASAIRRRSVLA
jgi:hypothetical protein